MMAFDDITDCHPESQSMNRDKEESLYSVPPPDWSSFIALSDSASMPRKNSPCGFTSISPKRSPSISTETESIQSVLQWMTRNERFTDDSSTQRKLRYKA